MKMVKFMDGTFGIRRGWWFSGYTFLDLQSTRFWWKPGSRFFGDCKGSYDEVLRRFLANNDVGKPVNPIPCSNDVNNNINRGGRHK